MQIGESTLQSVLEDKYGMKDLVNTEGRFVSLNEDHATSLVCLGLGPENLVIANIAFRGTSLDYDVKSLIPLSALSLSYLSDSKKIEINSENRSTNRFELCSCANQAEVWEKFTTAIDDLHQQEKKEERKTDSLKPFRDNKLTSDLVQSENESLSLFLYTDRVFSTQGDTQRQSPMYTESSVRNLGPGVSGKTTMLTASCDTKFASGWVQSGFVSQPLFLSTESALYTNSDTPRRHPRSTESSLSLPTRLPSQIKVCHTDIISKNHSSGYLNIEFDHFINDVSNLNVEVNELNTGMHVMSKTSTSDVSLNDDTKNDSGSKIMKFLRWIIPCCRVNK